MTAKELREMALQIQGIVGVHAMNKNELLVAIKEATGIETELSTSGGASDGRFIADICPQVIEIGPLNATIHKINECVAVSDLDALSRIYYLIMKKLLAG